MSQKYIEHNEVTREILNSIATGDLVKVNNWGKPMRVVGVLENYFCMVRKQFKDTIYSVCEKVTLPNGYLHNGMEGGKFHCSTDDRIFGYITEDIDLSNPNAEQYDFENAEWVKKYLQAFENKDLNLSERRGMAINIILIKKYN